jgi:hypothetical protein
MEAVELGPNLIENGGFEVWEKGKPKGWAWSSMADGKTWNLALFVGGFDEFEAYEGRRAMRVDGIWIQRNPELECARAGYWGDQIPLKPDIPYILSFYYKTTRIGNVYAVVWASYDPEVLFRAHKLPATEGKWREFIVIGWNRKEEMKMIKPLVLSFETGEVWFDKVKLREIFINAKIKVK